MTEPFTQEKVGQPASGWSMLFRNIALYGAALVLFFFMTASFNGRLPVLGALFLLLFLAALIAAILISAGFVVLQPNESAVLLLFGKYRYSVKESGF